MVAILSPCRQSCRQLMTSHYDSSAERIAVTLWAVSLPSLSEISSGRAQPPRRARGHRDQTPRSDVALPPSPWPCTLAFVQPLKPAAPGGLGATMWLRELGLLSSSSHKYRMAQASKFRSLRICPELNIVIDSDAIIG